jgi:2,5-diketo-D-gluconate reductase A
VIPKSVTPQRIRENFDVFDFELSEPEMDAIGGLDRGERIGPDPATFALA